ncbi:unnamed protein product [Clavelina lepadiformis]|uniref:Conserved oligomeric Golgi complex subunit 2 n=1 Tax=Clavelina lepadiformis TaxID=159417 RepID=A0ABP0GLG7_CLALP
MGVNKNTEKSERSQATSLLPLSPTPLCFDKNEFTKSNFSVDNFVADCRRRVQLETLRQDLEIYFKLLKNAMIELINKDYADFVNLSSNLVGMDKALVQLREPLKKIKSDVSEVEEVMKAQVVKIEATLAQQKQLTEKRKLLGHMQGLLDAINKIESIQMSEESNTGQVLERVSGEFNQLQHHAAYCKGLPVLNQNRMRISEITSHLQRSLEGELVAGISNGDPGHVHRCLNSYALISKTSDAETLVRVHVVQPFMRQVIEEQNGNVSEAQLKTLFNTILELVPNHLRMLCDITSGRKNKLGEQYRGIPGYDFIVNSAWPEIVLSLEKGLPEIFSSGDPNKFHKRYLLCLEFICNFERQCGSQASISRLRQSDAYNTLMTHWSLPVYFQIRFQEIGGKLETALINPAEKNDGSSHCEFRLNSTVVLWQCIKMCWKEDVFLQALIHRFWKLTLQLLSRYASWVKQIHGKQVSAGKTPTENKDCLSLNQLSDVILDTDEACIKVQRFYSDTIERHALDHGLKDTPALKKALDEALGMLSNHRAEFVKYIVQSLCAQSIPYLKQAQDVPRLFRKTNRPAPTEPSSYVTAVLKPVISFHKAQCCSVSSSVLDLWLTEYAATISHRLQNLKLSLQNVLVWTCKTRGM